MIKYFTYDSVIIGWYFVNSYICRILVIHWKKEIRFFVKGAKIIQSIYCSHKTKTTIVLNAAAGVETIAQKCTECGKLTNKQIDV